ncbi:MAG: hypothetical protein HZB42_08990 [Sphingobacteriales bacterium]|nr:hypothetical protein [Sphingobacteriales bacterium]
MHKSIVFFPLFLFLNCSYGQASLKIVDSINRKIDSIFRPNKAYDHPTTLDGCLRRDFPKNSMTDGRWVYYPETGNIQQIDKPEISKIIPAYSFYRVTMTNYLGYHVNVSGCLILYDSLNKKIELVQPIWYSDENELFLKHFIGNKFTDTTSLLKFVYELQNLMIVGTSGTFFNTRYQSDKITFDLTFGHVSVSPGIVNAVSGIWRTFEISLADNTLKEFKITNPRMNQSRIVK